MVAPWIVTTPITQPAEKWLTDSSTIRWYNGTTEEAATLSEWWDGASLQPMTIDGWWDGAVIQPLS